MLNMEITDNTKKLCDRERRKIQKEICTEKNAIPPHDNSTPHFSSEYAETMTSIISLSSPSSSHFPHQCTLKYTYKGWRAKK